MPPVITTDGLPQRRRGGWVIATLLAATLISVTVAGLAARDARYVGEGDNGTSKLAVRYVGG